MDVGIQAPPARSKPTAQNTVAGHPWRATSPVQSGSGAVTSVTAGSMPSAHEHLGPGSRARDAHDSVAASHPPAGDPLAEVAAADDEAERRSGGACLEHGDWHYARFGPREAACRSIHETSTTWAATASLRFFLPARVRPTPANLPAASCEEYRSS